MAEPNILCVALPVKSNRINAYNVQMLHEFGQTYPVTEYGLQNSLPSNSSGSEATFRVSSEGGFQPPFPNSSSYRRSPSEEATRNVCPLPNSSGGFASLRVSSEEAESPLPNSSGGFATFRVSSEEAESPLPNFSGGFATFRVSSEEAESPLPVLVIRDFQYEATSNGIPMSSFSENMLNMSYVCSILCKLLMIGSIVMIIIIIILSAHNKL
jgi:hypothetical protein